MTTNEQPIRILLIEDHKTVMWGLERLIECESTTMRVVGTASDCAAALAQAAALQPDILLLDIDLGGNCSIDILPALLASGAARALMLTGSRDQATLDRAVQCGARGVVCKDAPAEVVLQAIGQVHGGQLWLEPSMLARVFGALTTPKGEPQHSPEDERIALLTAKERKIAELIAESNGAQNKALAESLFISEHTLRNHLSSIYQKLGVSNRLELYVFTTKHQLGTHS